jgi:hypothetical protein
VFVASSAFVADRLFFFPSFWLVALVGLTIDALPSQRRLLVVATVAWSAQQAVMTALTAPAWRDHETLFARAAVVCPQNHRTRLGRAWIATRDRRAYDVAWHTLVAAAILARFPQPIAEDTFPAAWDLLPPNQRLERLTRAVGGSAAFAGIHAAAIDLAERESLFDAAQILKEWPPR